MVASSTGLEVGVRYIDLRNINAGCVSREERRRAIPGTVRGFSFGPGRGRPFVISPRDPDSQIDLATVIALEEYDLDPR
jgi:hypothetical protein